MQLPALCEALETSAGTPPPCGPAPQPARRRREPPSDVCKANEDRTARPDASASGAVAGVEAGRYTRDWPKAPAGAAASAPTMRAKVPVAPASTAPGWPAPARGRRGRAPGARASENLTSTSTGSVAASASVAHRMSVPL